MCEFDIVGIGQSVIYYDQFNVLIFGKFFYGILNVVGMYYQKLLCLQYLYCFVFFRYEIICDQYLNVVVLKYVMYGMNDGVDCLVIIFDDIVEYVFFQQVFLYVKIECFCEDDGWKFYFQCVVEYFVFWGICQIEIDNGKYEWVVFFGKCLLYFF